MKSIIDPIIILFVLAYPEVELRGTEFTSSAEPMCERASKGLQAGIYSDAGINTCASYYDKDTIGVGMGLYGHDEQDLTTFLKEWDFDFIKVDWLGLDEETRYTEIGKLANSFKSKQFCISGSQTKETCDTSHETMISRQVPPHEVVVLKIMGESLPYNIFQSLCGQSC